MTTGVWNPTMSLHSARMQLGDLLEEGAHCPCCGQMAKVYKRTIHAKMARDLIRLYHHSNRTSDAFIHIPTIVGHGGDIAKAHLWNLLEDEGTVRPDGGRAGYWRITLLGATFISGAISVPKYAHVYDGRRMKLDGPPVYIKDCLGSQFNYGELMAA